MSPEFSNILLHIFIWGILVSALIGIINVFSTRPSKPFVILAIGFFILGGVVVNTDAYEEYKIDHPREVDKYAFSDIDTSSPESCIAAFFYSWNETVQDIPKSQYYTTSGYAWYEKGTITEKFMNSILVTPLDDYKSETNDRGYCSDEKKLFKAMYESIGEHEYSYTINSKSEEYCDATISFSYSDVDVSFLEAESRYSEYEESLGHDVSAISAIAIAYKSRMKFFVTALARHDNKEFRKMFKEALENNVQEVSFDITLVNTADGWRVDSVNDPLYFLTAISGNANIWPRVCR